MATRGLLETRRGYYLLDVAMPTAIVSLVTILLWIKFGMKWVGL